MIERYYSLKIKDYLQPNKVLVLYGPRRVGKTTLITEFLKEYPGKIYSSTGENIQLRDILESDDFQKIIPFFSGYDLIVIDEAQKITNVGQGLKILVDQIKDIRIIATGSSSFDLSNKVGEPLVGRQNILTLFPLAMLELAEQYGPMYVQERLEQFLIYGSYPEVLTSNSFEEKRRYLTQIRDSYLSKDILELERIKNSKKLIDLLRLLAFQIGQEVSLQELGSALEMSKNTIARYLDLLEKAFVLVNARGFSRNLRKEVTKTSRYYFYDNGVRNALIDNFNPLHNRNDTGPLWENFLFIERLKKRTYHSIYGQHYFWRTWDQQEIDLVEEREGKLFGYEFKWNDRVSKPPRDWLATYPDATYEVITKENYMDFVL